MLGILHCMWLTLHRQLHLLAVQQPVPVPCQMQQPA